jgi:Xaa-Pro aminopeptidase
MTYLRHPSPLAALVVVLLVPSPAPAQTKSTDPTQTSTEAPRLLGQPAADYQARRRELMRRVKEAEPRRETIVVLRGDDDQDREDFEEGRFRQSNPFAHLTGVDIPGASLILLPGQGRETLYLPPKPGGSASSEASEAGALGFAEVKPTARFLGDLFSAIGDPGRRMRRRMAGGGGSVVYLLTPDPRPEANGRDARFTRFLREGAPGTTFRDIAPILGELRKAKSPVEIALLQKAIDITGEAQADVVRTLRPGLFEFQIEAKILGAFLDGGALRPGFSSIVGSGPNSTIPHYFLSARRMNEGELVVVDIGAEFQYYTADITRTYPVGGRFTPRQREVYQLVLDAQAEAARRAKPGETRLAEMTGWVKEFFRKSPLRAKDQEGREQTMDRFFIHGLGHYLGMDVHDVGDITRPIQPGEVFTIEPGLYIKSEDLGVRIEDDYLMTKDGPEKLSKAIPSDPDEVERRLAQSRATRDAPAHPPDAR